jgi:hypothetical protein
MAAETKSQLKSKAPNEAKARWAVELVTVISGLPERTGVDPAVTPGALQGACQSPGSAENREKRRNLMNAG